MALYLRYKLVAAIAFSMSLIACASGRAHQNFINRMTWDVGKGVDDPNILINWYKNNRGEIIFLANKNIEQVFLFHPNCRVFFEIDESLKMIVGWRFEGNEQDCAVVP